VKSSCSLIINSHNLIHSRANVGQFASQVGHISGSLAQVRLEVSYDNLHTSNATAEKIHKITAFDDKGIEIDNTSEYSLSFRPINIGERCDKDE